MGTLVFLGVLALIPTGIIVVILCHVIISVASGEEIEWNPRNTAHFVGGGPLDGGSISVRVLSSVYYYHGQQHTSIYRLQGNTYIFQESVAKYPVERRIP